jgi:hypothetical protein
MIVIGNQAAFYVMMGQQSAGVAGIFGGDKINIAEDIKGS